MTSQSNSSDAVQHSEQPEDWPALILMVRAWFEGNPDAALAELEQRARTAVVLASDPDCHKCHGNGMTHRGDCPARDALGTPTNQGPQS